MFNGRQFQIIELLKNKTVSLESLAKIVRKSSRTIMRDINTINEYIENINIGKIIFIKEDNGYELKIYDEEKLDELLKDWLNDEDTILYLLSTNEYVKIDDLSEKLYTSNPVISSKLVSLKGVYKNSFKICSCKKGHYIDEEMDIKINILSNLIYSKERYFLREMNLDFNIYLKMIEYFDKHKEEILLEIPNINARQMVSLCLAVYMLENDLDEFKEENIFSKMYTENNIKVSKNMIETLMLYSKKIRRKIKRITRGTILDVLLEIEDKHKIKLQDMDLVRELVCHISRGISYPVILKGHEVYSLTDIKALNPFAFDLSFIFSNMLEEEIGIKIYDKDLLALYFICALGRIKKTKQKIIIIGRQISFANINKSLIEDEVKDVEVYITASIQEVKEIQKESNIALLINNSSNIVLEDIGVKIIKISQIISNNEINEIKKILEDISLKEKIEIIFKKEYSFEYNVEDDDTWEIIIEKTTEKLCMGKVINEEEKDLIIQREKKENLLIINGISIPHAMSKRKDLCIGIYIKLSKDIVVFGECVNSIVIMVMNPENRKNNKIFSYMYRVFSNKTEIKNYKDFIKKMKER